MYAKRIIPCLDIKDGRVVKGINFLSLRDAGDPVETAAAYAAAGADAVSYTHLFSAYGTTSSASPATSSTGMPVRSRSSTRSSGLSRNK